MCNIWCCAGLNSWSNSIFCDHAASWPYAVIHCFDVTEHRFFFLPQVKFLNFMWSLFFFFFLLFQLLGLKLAVAARLWSSTLSPGL